MSAVVAPAMPINTKHNSGTPTNANTISISDEDLVYTCLHCSRTFTSHIGMVGHLRIHRTETEDPVAKAPVYTRHTRIHCPRTFLHRMGLLDHMFIHESGIDRSPNTPSTSSTPTMPSPAHTPSPSAPTVMYAKQKGNWK
nr:unnamed protein product [Spirometra erinaceieuropaei]